MLYQLAIIDLENSEGTFFNSLWHMITETAVVPCQDEPMEEVYRSISNTTQRTSTKFSVSSSQTCFSMFVCVNVYSLPNVNGSTFGLRWARVTRNSFCLQGAYDWLAEAYNFRPKLGNWDLKRRNAFLYSMILLVSVSACVCHILPMVWTLHSLKQRRPIFSSTSFEHSAHEFALPTPLTATCFVEILL